MEVLVAERLVAAAAESIDWSAAYARYGPELLAYLFRLTSERQAAEDLLQDTFGRALAASRPPTQLAELRPWLYRIATNLAIDRVRRLRRHHAVGLSNDVAALGCGEEEQSLVRETLRAMSLEDASILILRLHERFSCAEIATLLGLSERRVKARLERARISFVTTYRRLEKEMA